MKKIIAMIMMTAMLISSLSVFGAGFSDVDTRSPLYESIQLLSKLNILKGYEDGTFRPERTVKRCEFTAMVVRALELEDVAATMGDKQSFTDVSSNHWAAGCINLAADMGIINGRGEGIFDPEGNVLHEEAIKMLMVAMDYTDLAENCGGYPNGYIQIAKTIGALDGITVEKGRAATRKTIAEMFCNSLADEYVSGGNSSSGNTSNGNASNGNTSNGNTSNGNTSNGGSQTNNGSAYEKKVLDLVNEIRKENGLGTLSWSDALGKTARAHSADMRDRNFMDHTNPDGLSPFDRMKNAGISYRTAGENIAAGQKTPEEVVNGWMNSPGHRANILNPQFTALGVGYAAGGSYGHYWTQNFTG